MFNFFLKCMMMLQTCSGEPMTPEEMARKDRERQEKKLRLGSSITQVRKQHNPGNEAA
jgi:hypothetical protein